MRVSLFTNEESRYEFLIKASGIFDILQFLGQVKVIHRVNTLNDCKYRCRNTSLWFRLRGISKIRAGHNLNWPHCLVINPDYDAAADRLVCTRPNIQMNWCRCRKVPALAHRHRGCHCTNTPFIHLSCICPAVMPQAFLSSTLCSRIKSVVVSPPNKP